jgi:acyl-CoA thioesterase FadM
MSAQPHDILADYPWVEDVTAPDAAAAGHIDNIQITELLFGAWTRYLVPGLGVERTFVYRRTGRPIVRSIGVSFEAEIHAGQALRCGVRMLGRGRRSFTLEQLLVRDGTPVARGHVVLVTLDERAGHSVAIPGELWAAVEKFEGREIVPDPRTG